MTGGEVELEPVWSGDRGVYIGSCLRQMPAYQIRNAEEGERVVYAEEPRVFESASLRAQIRALLTKEPGLTTGEVSERLGRRYARTVGSAMAHMARKGLLTASEAVSETFGRPGRLYFVGPVDLKAVAQNRFVPVSSKVKDAIQSGMTSREIAAASGVTRRQTRKALKRLMDGGEIVQERKSQGRSTYHWRQA